MKCADVGRVVRAVVLGSGLAGGPLFSLMGCGGGAAAPQAATTTVAPATPTGVSVTVDTGAQGVIRADIGRTTFGSGVAFDTSQLRWSLDRLRDSPSATPVSSNTRDAIKALQLGTLRFPNGDSSFLYISEDPSSSYPSVKPVTPWNRYLTPEEIIRYTARDQLDMERLFEVNTVFWLDKGATWTFRYLNERQFTAGATPQLSTAHLATAADRAADWVRRDAGQTLLWEVGNEDWARWNAEQHAEIFNTFQDRMKAVRPDIRLLAQGLAQPYGANTPEAWLQALKHKLAASGRLDSVYAYSVHQYLQGGDHAQEKDVLARRRKQTQDMLAQVAKGEPVERVKGLLQADPSTRRWKVWMTEFNVQQPSGVRAADGTPAYEAMQDMAHALVLADWTGKLLEQNVERLFVHSLDHHPRFALVQYANQGADIEHPVTTAPGLAFGLYAQSFGPTMLRSKTSANPTLVAPSGQAYPQLASYASLSADGRSLKVVLINRHLSEPVRVALDTQAAPARRRLADGQATLRQLFANALTDTNLVAASKVQWREPLKWPQSSTAGLRDLTLQPASINLLTVPLAPVE